MCLIAYVPSGASVPRDYFDYAAEQNPDGIGIMSQDGVRKFYGRRMLRKARRYAACLSKAGTAYGVHWRFATHGEVSQALCHPFKLPNADAYVMHNGILDSTAPFATATESDTSLYVSLLTEAPTVADGADLPYWGAVRDDIGHGNKFLVFYPACGTFYILNEGAGHWTNGVWYSNRYSLPSAYTYEWDWNDPLYAPPGPRELDSDWQRLHRDLSAEDRDFVTPSELERLKRKNDYAPSKRFNVVTLCWEDAADRKAFDAARWWRDELDKAFPLPGDDKPAYPSGPTLCESALLPIDNGGYDEVINS